MIRVVLPFHLKNLARVEGEVQLELASPVTIKAVLDAVEAKHPALRGTIREEQQGCCQAKADCVRLLCE